MNEVWGMEEYMKFDMSGMSGKLVRKDGILYEDSLCIYNGCCVVVVCMLCGLYKICSSICDFWDDGGRERLEN